VLANIRHHQPREIPEPAVLTGEGDWPFNETYVSPGRGSEIAGVVVRHSGEEETVIGELVPFLARDLTGFAADADSCIGKEALGADRAPPMVRAVRAEKTYPVSNDSSHERVGDSRRGGPMEREQDVDERDQDPVPDRPENEDELVDKESADSFPASDPPSY
jgi:hypothetical protein